MTATRTHPGQGRFARFGLAWLASPRPMATLAWFRILFGLMMTIAVIRFGAHGWIKSLYIDPTFHFTYAGFSWVRPLGFYGTHALFAIMGLAALGLMLGWKYRFSAWIFFLAFTYAELLDKTNYLNHYYFVSIIAFLFLWVPAHKAYSLDARRLPESRPSHAALWHVGVFKLQIALVYFYAGLAKLNGDWLFHAQPLSLWLPGKSHLPWIGPWLALQETAYVFSWAGALFDLSIAFFLLWRRTVYGAFAVVVVFHALTAWLFPVIGIFPWVMMAGASIFLPSALHARLLKVFDRGQAPPTQPLAHASRPARPAPASPFTSPLPPPLAWIGALTLLAFFAFQLIFPLRHLAYPGKLFWTERGYRFSWRVMLMEKSGYATFHVTDPATGRKSEISNCDYLTPAQEKMMVTQPDMILDFARHIAADFSRQGLKKPEVRVESYVTLNGRGSRLYIDPTLDLAALPPGSDLTPWLEPHPKDL